jgi:predicted N-acyltransferase
MQLPADLSMPAAIPLGNGMYGRVARSVSELVDRGLADIPGEAVWTSSRWWRFVEQDDGHEILYLVLEDATSGPVGVAPAILVRDRRNLLFYNSPRILGDFSAIGSRDHLDAAECELAASLAPAIEGIRENLYPSLTVGVFGSNFGLRPFAAGRPFDQSVLVPGIARLAAALRDRWKLAGFSLLYLDPVQDAFLSGSSSELGLQRVLFGGEGLLNVPSGGIEGYLRSLPGTRRNKIRREMRAYAEQGITTAVESGTGSLGDEYLPLRTALRAKYGHAAGMAWARGEFQALRDAMGEELVVFSARRGEQILGYMMAFRKGDVLFTRAAGFDYNASAGAFCYFNLVYYDVIRWAEREGVQRIHYGLGTSQAKHYRGCVFVPRWAYFSLARDTPAEVRTMLGLQHGSAARLLGALTEDTVYEHRVPEMAQLNS